jgi:hypothetical protein
VIQNAYQVKAYERLGIDVSKLGCIMLEFEQVPVKNWLPEDWAYYAKDIKKYDWITGLDVKSHVTLLYGLLEKGFIWKEYVDEVLDGWIATDDMFIRELKAFPPAPGEDYACLVGVVESWGSLEKAHKLLSFLPHVNTYLEYIPHLTLGYVKSEYKDDAMRLLHQARDSRSLLHLQPKGLSYGDKHL